MPLLHFSYQPSLPSSKITSKPPPPDTSYHPDPLPYIKEKTRWLPITEPEKSQILHIIIISLPPVFIFFFHQFLCLIFLQNFPRFSPPSYQHFVYLNPLSTPSFCQFLLSFRPFVFLFIHKHKQLNT